ncbi:MAG TPA: YfiR family protein [Candidatus Acidoferrales bacterium]|nr:YfiR family protein [Candidatus Acidoferrales bacterium]
MEILTTCATVSSWLFRLLALLLALQVCPDLLAATNPATNTANEYALKAAFLYKFASFVVWPDSNASEPLCIGVAGDDPFGSALDEVVKGKSINGRTFEIRRFAPGQMPGNCQILFISGSEKNGSEKNGSEKKKLPAVLDHVQGVPILTVGDMAGFCESGGMIRLGLEDNRIIIEINPAAAEKAGLQLSSKLLGVARIVRSARNAK